VKRLSAALLILVAGLASGIAAGCGSSGGSTSEATTTAASQGLNVQLQEQNFSGEDGQATLTAKGQKTLVVIQMASYAANAQPAHIHKGTCAKLDPTPAYPLNNVVQGKSRTMVNVPLAKLMEKYAINMHRSAKQMKIYVACGDISKNQPPTPTETVNPESGSGSG